MSKDSKIEEVKGLFAFWYYDLYPYCLGAEISRMNDKGSAYAPSYKGWFTPIKVLPAKAGKILLEHLERLRAGHREAREALDATWNAELFDLMPEARSPDRTYAGFPRKVDDKK